jgi:DNA-binding SARP family transcriptional activator/tetratricopeptide (TPR) repeat protein
VSGLTVGVLGPLQVAVQGEPVQLGASRLRTLVALLALSPDAPVSLERLAMLMWPGQTPDSPRRSLQTYIGRLRAALGTRWVESTPSGVALRVRPDDVDAVRFERLVEQAAGAGERERELLVEALGLWRGEPFEGVGCEWLDQTEAPRLVERRLTALERRIDLDLATGGLGELVAELGDWTARYPLREPLWARLLVALDRTGRQAEALHRYEQLRQRLADDLGTDPSPELQRLHAGLLAGRPIGKSPSVEPAPRVASDAAAGTAAMSSVPERTVPVVPRQLPAAPPAFTGRASELTDLDRARDMSAVVITAIDGMAGVGKTALAVHAAHQLTGHYPDGQLFIDLHGYTEGVAPVEPDEALERMLRALGVPGDQIPRHLDDRAALYRSTLADRKVLVLLDNAASEDQVAPLLPGSAGCTVLVTSRRRLTGLDHTSVMSLDVLPTRDAVALFTSAAGEHRTAGASSEMLAEVAELCGRLPLAVRIAAARLRSRPAWTVEDLVGKLRDQRRRLAELEAGRRSVAAALELSYQDLDAQVQRGYRLLGLHPGAELDVYAVAALLDTSVDDAERLANHLIDAHLLQEPVTGRFRFHDLVRDHARAMASREEAEAARQAIFRLLGFYRHTASVAMDAAYPHERHRRPDVPQALTPVPDLPSPAAAGAWLDGDMSNLITAAQHATEHGWLDYAPHLSATLHHHLHERGHNTDDVTLHSHALAAARASGNRVGEANALAALGRVYWLQGRTAQASESLELALARARAVGHDLAEIEVLATLGTLRSVQGRHDLAVEHFTMAREGARRVSDHSIELEALLGLAWLDIQHGEPAIDELERCLALARTLGDGARERTALQFLGHAHRIRGQLDQAVGFFEQALHISRSGGHRRGHLSSLVGLADVHRKLGNDEQAATHYQQAITLARETDNPNWEYEAVQGLGRLDQAAGRLDQAIAHHQHALDLATKLGQPPDEARAHDGLAHAHRARGQHEHARRHWQRALDILTELGLDHTEDDEATVATIRAHLGDLGS